MEAIMKKPKSKAILYHATALSNLESIREHGLSGTFGKLQEGCIHFTQDVCQAKGYFGHWNEGVCVLLSVKIADLPNLSALGPDREDLMDILDQEGDDRDWSDLDWRASLKLCGQCTYEGVVPSSILQVESYEPAPYVTPIAVQEPLSTWNQPTLLSSPSI
jgi:hypothetical protein